MIVLIYLKQNRLATELTSVCKHFRCRKTSVVMHRSARVTLHDIAVAVRLLVPGVSNLDEIDNRWQSISINRLILIIDDQLMAKIRVVIDWYNTWYWHKTSCVDIMTRKGNDGQVGNSSTRATGYTLCVGKTGSELFYQFRPQGFPKKADDRGSARDICLRLLCRSIATDERFFVWLSIDHRLTDTNRYQLTNFIDWYRLHDRLVFRSSISIDCKRRDFYKARCRVLSRRSLVFRGEEQAIDRYKARISVS